MPSIQFFMRDLITNHILEATAHSSSARELAATGTTPAGTAQSASPASNASVNIALSMVFMVLGILCVCGAVRRFALYRRRQKPHSRNCSGLVDLTAWVSEKTRDSDKCLYDSPPIHAARAPSIYLDISRELCLDATIPPVAQRSHPSDGQGSEGIQSTASSDGLLPPERALVKPTLSVVTTFIQEPRDIRVPPCSKLQQEASCSNLKPICTADIHQADVTPPPAYSFSTSYLGQASAKERSTFKRQSSWIHAPPSPSPPPALPVRVTSQAPQLPPIPTTSNQVIYLSYDPNSRCRDRFSVREDAGPPIRHCRSGGTSGQA